MVASISPCRWAKPSASVTPSRSKIPRIISEASPCVGGGMLNTSPHAMASDSGGTRRARNPSRSSRRNGLPACSSPAAKVSRQVAAIEIVKPGFGKPRQRRRQLRLLEHVAFGRKPARRIGGGKAGHIAQLRPFARGERRLRGGDADAFARMPDRVGEQQRTVAACPPAFPRHTQRLRPAGHRARDGERGARPPRRDRPVAMALRKSRGVRQPRRRPAGADADRGSPRQRDQPEPIAANARSYADR